jgi:hypothetical protein
LVTLVSDTVSGNSRQRAGRDDGSGTEKVAARQGHGASIPMCLPRSFDKLKGCYSCRL